MSSPRGIPGLFPQTTTVARPGTLGTVRLSIGFEMPVRPRRMARRDAVAAFGEEQLSEARASLGRNSGNPVVTADDP